MSGSNKVAMTDRDRISNLPDDVIGDILSRLSTEDAVKTSVLSKRWKYKWTFINQIIIDDERNVRLRDLDHPVIVKSVERTLVRVQNATRIKIKLLSNQSSDVPKSWMDSLSRHTVEELDLYIEHGNIVLSTSLLNMIKLRTLVLRVQSFAVSSKNQFPNLTRLGLGCVNVMNQNADTDGTLMCTFPVLEKLLLYKCRWFNVKSVEIHAPTLNFLGVVHPIPSVEHDYTISIHCARLAEYKTLGGRLQENLILNGSAVVSAELSLSVEDEKLRISGVEVRSLLRQMSSSLKCLRLSMSAAQAILESKQGYSYPRVKLDKLEELCLSSYYICTRQWGTEALFELLYAAPSLKVLSTNLAKWTDFKYDDNVIESVPSCITSSLKIVKLFNYNESRPRHGLEKLFRKAGVTIKSYKSNEEDE